MSVVLSIVRRELQAYFVSPIAYTVMVTFLIIASFGFQRALITYVAMGEFRILEIGASLRTYVIGQSVLWMMIGLIFSLPALSMRLFSEERKNGTAELLLTSPVTTAHLVLGKWLGGMAVLAMMLTLSLTFPLVLEWQASPEWMAVFAAYAGLLLYGGVLLAIGVFASSLTENQIVALVLTYAMSLPFWMVELLVGFVGGTADDILAGLSLNHGLQLMGRGLVNSHYLVLFGALIFGFLFLCVQVLDSNRWR
jgi:ABC-2 type transport system permease protein